MHTGEHHHMAVCYCTDQDAPYCRAPFLRKNSSMRVQKIPRGWGRPAYLYTHRIFFFFFLSEVPINDTLPFHSPQSYLSPPSKFSWPGERAQGGLNYNLILMSVSYPTASNSLHPEFPKCFSPEFDLLKTMVGKNNLVYFVCMTWTVYGF